MNKKILAVVLSLSLLQAPPAQAGFFDFFKKNFAFIGVALVGILALRSVPRSSDSAAGNTATNSESSDGFQSRSTLADDPNDYQASTELVDQPSTAECNPTTTSHRCSYMESSQVATNSCVNPVSVRASSPSNDGVRTGN